MSYCVNCGVELDDTAAVCPLCHTPVQNPRRPVDLRSPKPFPTERSEVPPVSRRGLALLLTAMFLSVAACSGLLNLLLPGRQVWSLYVVCATVMLWIWFVPPLLGSLDGRVQLVIDLLAVALYLLFIALHLDGLAWYLYLALPILALLGVLLLALGALILKRRRSGLSSVMLLLGAGGIFAFGLECFSDRFLYGAWRPGWSLIVLAVVVAMVVPLFVVRHVPSLREEFRRRFHL